MLTSTDNKFICSEKTLNGKPNYIQNQSRENVLEGAVGWWHHTNMVSWLEHHLPWTEVSSCFWFFKNSSFIEISFTYHKIHRFKV